MQRRRSAVGCGKQHESDCEVGRALALPVIRRITVRNDPCFRNLLCKTTIVIRHLCQDLQVFDTKPHCVQVLGIQITVVRLSLQAIEFVNYPRSCDLLLNVEQSVAEVITSQPGRPLSSTVMLTPQVGRHKIHGDDGDIRPQEWQET